MKSSFFLFKMPAMGIMLQSITNFVKVIFNNPEFQDKSGDPYGIRTRVAGVKGQCPRPLDEGVACYLLPVCLLKDDE